MPRVLLIILALLMLHTEAFARSSACVTDAKAERAYCLRQTAKNGVRKRICIERYNATLDYCAALPSDPLNPPPPPGSVDPLNPALPRGDPPPSQFRPVPRPPTVQIPPPVQVQPRRR